MAHFELKFNNLNHKYQQFDYNVEYKLYEREQVKYILYTIVIMEIEKTHSISVYLI